MAAMSYVAKKGYIKDYENAQREAGLAVYASRVCEEQYMVAHPVPAGEVQPELEAYEEAEAKVREKNLVCIEVSRKMFVLLAKTLGTNGPPSWTPKSKLKRGRI
jgi:hypothetical protein